MFIDYITVKQAHKPHKPYSGNHLISFNPETEEYEVFCVKFKNYEGSDSTIIQIKSDGITVKVSGNIGRFNRPENLFNYTLEQTMFKLNQILKSLNLPEFTKGEIEYYENRKKGTLDKVSTGARFLRLDLTENYALKSHTKCVQYFHQISNIKINKQQIKQYENTVYWGFKSTHKQLKAYIKCNDLKRLLRKKDVPQREYIEKVTEYAKQNGTIRLELQLREYLAKNSLAYWAQTTHEKLTEIYEGEIMNIPKQCESVKALELNQSERSTLALYMVGIDLKDPETMPRSTYYKHKKILLKHGVDISIPLPKNEIVDLSQFAIDVELKPLQKPDWYQLPLVNENITKQKLGL